ncbi:MAG: tRNA (N6-isopentenyl adenosine(37)-C2)-methylthiotransferase MiaB [Burkholderiaceae bacterium]|nr:tRNA (N6-isopentenyl adenosine(37)-C2)-methylthiotransferase MiaB [Burkholderiaceae bacterium]
MKKLYVRTFGCQMNEYDSGKIADVLERSHGATLTEDPAAADIIVFNTCSVREKAQEKVFSDLGRIRKLKHTRPHLLIAVGGCVASQEGAAIIKRAPYVDLVFGPQTLHRLPEMIAARAASGLAQVDISFPRIEKFDNLPAARVDGASAFVSIMEGCSKFCSYCIVPYTRGLEVSRPLDDVLTEIGGLAQQGVREVTLLGQNVNAYRSKLADQKIDLATLLARIAEIRGIERIRYMTSHPREFTAALIEAHRNIDKLAGHVHLPVQSGSDRVLAAMKRRYTTLEFKSIVRQLREARPGISISSDFIVGFPGETEDDFERTMRLIEDVGFDASFSFIYSPRPGTPAAELEDTTAPELKLARLQRLQEAIDANARAISAAMLGSRQMVLVEGTARHDQEELSGRTDNNRVVNFAGPHSAIGSLVPVEITAVRAHTLRGSMSAVTLAAAAALFAGWLGYAEPAHAQWRGATMAAGPNTTATIEEVSPLARLLRDGRTLLTEGRSGAAYTLLKPSETGYAGSPEFDYLLGVAALDSGRPAEAVIVLERVLIQRPDHLPARAELARAYLRVNETEASRQTFEAVATRELPPEVRATIERYLDAIERIKDATRVKRVATLEAEIGYDGNVNLGTASGQWLLADGTAVLPLPVSEPAASTAVGLGGSLNWVIPTNGGWRVTVGGRFAVRAYPSARTLDQEQYELSGRIARRFSCHEVGMQLQAQTLRLDGTRLRDGTGVLAQWHCDTERAGRLGAYLQHYRFDFPDQSVRNADRTAMGFTLARQIEALPSATLIAGLNFGNERSRASYDNLSYDFWGLRAIMVIGLGSGWQATGALGWEARNFDGLEPEFGVTREDRQTEAQISAEKKLRNGLTIGPVLTYTRNHSTVGPNDFRRGQAVLRARYRF